MHRVCPLPKAWAVIHKELEALAKAKQVEKPPVPLILGGWNFSSDAQKSGRWEDTVTWAKTYGAEHILTKINDDDFYYVSEYRYPREWDWSRESVPAATRPSDEQLETLLRLIQENWEGLAEGFSQQTIPVSFSGEKARTLNVKLLATEPLPPWGTWGLENVRLHSQKFTSKVKFTVFRKSINLLIAPHKVDHVDFFYMKKIPNAPRD